jgi:peptidoglycan hydrolase-like protein with peptidoglycan-binding domain
LKSVSTRIDGPKPSAPVYPTPDVDPAVADPTAATTTATAAPDDSFGKAAPDSAPGGVPPAPPSLLKRNDNQQSADPKVMDLQKQVNAWRAANGQPPIKEDGFYGPQTQTAVRQFQKANGLGVDGEAGVRTQARLAMEDDPTFKALDPSVQDVVRKNLTAASDHTDQIDNLKAVATQPGFEKLSPDIQKQLLNTQWANRNDADVASNLAAIGGDATFRNLNDATKSQVIANVGALTGYPAGQQNVVKLATAPGFDKLSPTHQQQMLTVLNAKDPGDTKVRDRLIALASDPKFDAESDATKTAMINLAGDPATPDANVKAATDLTESPAFSSLSDTDKALVNDGVKAAKGDPAYDASVRALIEDPNFKNLSAAEKTAALSQAKNYPDARSVKNIERALAKDWFKTQSLSDKQRSLKTIGYLSQYDSGDRAVIDNTLNKFLDPKSNFQVIWKDYNDPPGSGTTFGEGADSKLWLNRAKVADGDGPLPITDDTKHLVLDTVPHEVNHLMNGDKVDKTYKYFEAEYRAWYVGFKAEHGRVPTNEEAMEQRISWQLNPSSFYGKYAAEALKDPKEAAKFYTLLSNLSGKKVDASNFKTVAAEDPNTWPTKNDPAPVPAGNLDNH